LRAEKAHGKQHQISFPDSLTARHFGKRRVLSGFRPIDIDGLDACDMASTIVNKTFRNDRIAAWITAKHGFGFFVTIIPTINLRPLRPGIVVSPARRRPPEQLEVDQAGTAMTQRSANAIR